MNKAAASKTPWYNNTMLVIFLCLLIFPLGLYALWKSNRLGKGSKIALSFFTVLAALVILSVSMPATEAATATEQKTEVEKSKPFNWKIAKLDSTGNQLTFRITIDDRTSDRSQLIEVARQLKNEREWDEKLVCFFDIKVYSRTFAWASCAYLPNCEECATDKDSDGNNIEYRLIGMTAGLADSLRALTMDSIPAKTVVASYLDDISQCKAVLYRVEKEPNKLVMARLFIGGGKIVEWYPMKKVGGEERYYAPDDDEGNYFVLDTVEQVINYYNAKGDWWWSVALVE